MERLVISFIYGVVRGSRIGYNCTWIHQGGLQLVLSIFLPVRYHLDGALSGVYLGRRSNSICIITGVLDFLGYMGFLFWLPKIRPGFGRISVLSILFSSKFLRISIHRS
jgi:hypothetical protein